MAIGIDDLDDDDILLAEDSEQQPSVWEPPRQEEQPVQQEEPKSDLMSDFLRSKGIDDMSRIKFEDENNNIVERNWNDLSREEQLNIMNTPLDDYNYTDYSNSWKIVSVIDRYYFSLWRIQYDEVLLRS